MARINQDLLHFILKDAIMAPSADNQHRIRFQLVEDTIRVRYTETELPPMGSYKRALALLSLGAVAENLTIAASRFGISTKSVLLPDLTRPNLVMQIRLQVDQVAVDPLWQFIPIRHTNRRILFHGPQMSKVEQSELDAAAHTYSASHLVWLDERKQRKQTLRLMRLAETERFRNRILHQELFSAIRFDVGWYNSCPEGMPPGALGVEPALRSLFTLMRHWPIMRLANLLGAHYFLGWRACDLPCRLAPDLGLLAVKNTDNQTIFNTGRSFQRLWLTATSQGRVLQPMPASALFALKGALAEGIPANLQHDLSEGWKASLHGAIPLILFRIGFAKSSSIVAGRRALADYLEAEGGNN